MCDVIYPKAWKHCTLHYNPWVGDLEVVQGDVSGDQDEYCPNSAFEILLWTTDYIVEYQIFRIVGKRFEYILLYAISIILNTNQFCKNTV